MREAVDKQDSPRVKMRTAFRLRQTKTGVRGFTKVFSA